MLTREQIEEIQSESREKGLSIKKLLEEKGIPAHQYFWWKRKYVREQIAEGVLPVAEFLTAAAECSLRVHAIEPCGIDYGKQKVTEFFLKMLGTGR